MITVVSGAPCSGKSTYVVGLSEPGDIVVDMDLLASALTVSDNVHVYSNEVRAVARAARRAAVGAALSVGQSGVRVNVWIVHTDPSADALRRYRVSGARVKVLNPGRDECLARLLNRPQSEHVRTKRVIDEWFAKH